MDTIIWEKNVLENHICLAFYRFSDTTSFPNLQSENVSLRIAKLFSLCLRISRPKITMMKTHKEQKNIQYLNVRVEMHGKELQK